MEKANQTHNRQNTEVLQTLHAVRDIKAGEELKQPDLEIHTQATVCCYNPKCGEVISWCQEDLAKNDVAPEAFFRMLTLTRSYVNAALQSTDPGKYVFCSAYCLIQWLKHAYIPSCSPVESRRRTEAQAVANAAFEKDRDTGTGQDALPDISTACPSIGFDKEPGVSTPTIEVPPLDAAPSEVEPVEGP